MAQPSLRIMSLAAVQEALDSGFLVMLVPTNRPLQPPTQELVMVPVSLARVMEDPNQLKIDVIGPDSILLIQSGGGDGRHG